jgi:hypothetical protein
MADDSIARDVRKLQRERRLGDDAACTVCGETTPEQLSRVGRALLDEHHLAGRVNDPAATVLLCRNCHALVTARMLDAAIPLGHRDQRCLLERLEAVLRAIAVFATVLAEMLARWADQVAGLISALDRAHPRWRDLEEAR